jgi:hypothetical protein
MKTVGQSKAIWSGGDLEKLAGLAKGIIVSSLPVACCIYSARGYSA